PAGRPNFRERVAHRPEAKNSSLDHEPNRQHELSQCSTRRQTLVDCLLLTLVLPHAPCFNPPPSRPANQSRKQAGQPNLASGHATLRLPPRCARPTASPVRAKT